MTQYAGQMLPAGNPAAVSAHWVAANGRFYLHARASDYHKRHGFRPGAAGIYLLRVPPGPSSGTQRWLVLLRDDPTQPDLPADTPTASAPPTGLPAFVTTNIISSPQVAGPVAVSGILSPAATAVQAAPNNNGVIGAFAALTTTGTSFAGTVVMAAGASMRIRVRVVGATYNYEDSNVFTVTA